jgi:hypothetical protein
MKMLSISPICIMAEDTSFRARHCIITCHDRVVKNKNTVPNLNGIAEEVCNKTS